jgi:hypothetical protein
MVAQKKHLSAAPPDAPPELREVQELVAELKRGPLARSLERLHGYLRRIIEEKDAQIAEARRAAERSATAHTVRPSVQALANAITPAAGSVLPESTAYAQAIWQSGYEQGVEDTEKRFRDALSKEAAEFQAVARAVLARHVRASKTAPTGETPQQKSARLRRTARLIRDEQQAREMAALIRQGDTTEQAREKMKIGVVRAQRIRATAVGMGLLDPRHRIP